MLIVLENVLTADELSAMRRKVQQAEYVSGATTAGEGSKSRKNNLQISERDAILPELQTTVLDALARHQVFQFLAVPKLIMPPMFNRYDVGMYYQNHVDFSLVGLANAKVRTDLAMTLFLSGKDEYDGGELVVESANGAQAIKLDVNQAIVYPAGQLHRANPVTRGSRLAAITAIQSFIRDESKRDLLVDVMQLARTVQDRVPGSDEARLANKIHANLLRLWAE
ncbi:MAG TPA: Fe2+-dependent dioxygenase [Gammaproteobacteria bacterium]|jgi:PKHD-type hydroxylase|nr:Fe2+-dependent dioxygenase [Gammaproteobacteria bacterium]